VSCAFFRAPPSGIDYGASGCNGWGWYYYSINRIKELPTDEIILTLKQPIDNYKKKYPRCSWYDIEYRWFRRFQKKY
jgi:hypothetical protein